MTEILAPDIYEAHWLAAWPQNRDCTEAQLLGFSYDFAVTVICHKLKC
jgi:hypothetical protein